MCVCVADAKVGMCVAQTSSARKYSHEFFQGFCMFFAAAVAVAIHFFYHSQQLFFVFLRGVRKDNMNAFLVFIFSGGFLFTFLACLFLYFWSGCESGAVALCIESI